MDLQSHFVVNSGLSWFIVLMAVAGYFLTLRRLKQKWVFWVMLIVGWTLLAVSNSLSALGIGQGSYYLLTIWLLSYVLVIASLVLLFFKLIQVMKTKSQGFIG